MSQIYFILEQLASSGSICLMFDGKTIRNMQSYSKIK